MNRSHWPITTQPQDDELLSSWLYRAAQDNAQKLHTFCDVTTIKDNIWTRDIDYSISLSTLDRVASRLNVNRERAYKTTLRDYVSFLFEKESPNIAPDLILKYGIRHRTRRYFAQQFCPICFSKDKKPYFRRFWRLAIAFGCPVHKCKLLDACKSCGQPIAFFRNDIRANTLPSEFQINRCSECGANLSKQTTDALSDNCYLHLQDIHQVLNSGYWKVDKRWVYSFSYFSVLRKLMVYYRRKTKKEIAPHSHSIELERSTFRFKALIWAKELLDNWPNSFNLFLISSRVTHSEILQNNWQPPFWFIKNLNEFCPKDKFPRTKTEKESAQQLLKRVGLRTAKHKLNTLNYDDIKKRLVASTMHE